MGIIAAKAARVMTEGVGEHSNGNAVRGLNARKLLACQVGADAGGVKVEEEPGHRHFPSPGGSAMPSQSQTPEQSARNIR